MKIAGNLLAIHGPFHILQGADIMMIAGNLLAIHEPFHILQGAAIMKIAGNLPLESGKPCRFLENNQLFSSNRPESRPFRPAMPANPATSCL